MKKYLITLITIICVMVLVLSPVKVKAAAEDITLSVSSETKNIKEGDKVTVTFTVKDAKKINGFEAELKEDDVFKVESVTADSKFNSWSTTKTKIELTANEANETLTITIILNVISTPKDKASFTINNIKVNEDNTDWTADAIVMGSKSIEFSPTVEEKKEEEKKEENKEEQKEEEKKEEQKTDTSIVVDGGSSSSKSSSTTATTKIPQTGENDILVTGIILFSILAVIGYIGYRKNKCI